VQYGDIQDKHSAYNSILLTDCYHEIATVHFLHIVIDIRVAINNMKVLSVAIGKK
jgi:hypothetical protein